MQRVACVAVEDDEPCGGAWVWFSPADDVALSIAPRLDRAARLREHASLGVARGVVEQGILATRDEQNEHGVGEGDSAHGDDEKSFHGKPARFAGETNVRATWGKVRQLSVGKMNVRSCRKNGNTIPLIHDRNARAVKTPVLLLILYITLALRASDAPPMSERKVADISVTISEDAKVKGILLFLPKSISASRAGEDFIFEYTVVNMLEEKIFFQTVSAFVPPTYLSASFTAPDSDFSLVGGGAVAIRSGTNFARYALLDGSKYYDDGTRQPRDRPFCLCPARIKIPKGIKAGWIARLRIHVNGYFLKNGEPFKGEIEVSIPVTK